MAKQKSRFPSYGLVRGPSHAQGGVAGVVAGKQPVELEGGEWVVPKEVVPDYLPQLVQMTNEGRAMQGMDNGNSAIDALIASSVMQNGVVSPKSPHYQAGGEVAPSVMDYLQQMQGVGQKYQGDIMTEAGARKYNPEGMLTKEGLSELYNFPLEQMTLDTLMAGPRTRKIAIKGPEREAEHLQTLFGLSEKEGDEALEKTGIRKQLASAYPTESSRLGYLMDDAGKAIKALDAGYLDMDMFERMNWERKNKQQGGPIYSYQGGGGVPEDFLASLKGKEGSLNLIYKDSLGKPTGGMGHLMTDSELKDYGVSKYIDHPTIYGPRKVAVDAKGDIIQLDEGVTEDWVKNDSEKAYNAALAQAKELGIDNQKMINALGSVNFQLGAGWRKEGKFPAVWEAMKSGDYGLAAENVQWKVPADTLQGVSDWYEQTPTRAKDFMEALRGYKKRSGGPVYGYQQGGEVGWGDFTTPEDFNKHLVYNKLYNKMAEANGRGTEYSDALSRQVALSEEGDPKQLLMDRMMERSAYGNGAEQYGVLEDTKFKDLTSGLQMGSELTAVPRFKVSEEYAKEGDLEKRVGTSREQVSLGSLPVLSALSSLASKAGVTPESTIGRLLNAPLPLTLEKDIPSGKRSYSLGYTPEYQKQGGPIDYYQTGGQALPRKQQEMRSPDSGSADMDSLLKQIMMRGVNQSTGDSTASTVLDSMKMQQGGMVGGTPLMQDMSQDKRVKPLQPDRYVVTGGKMTKQEMEVPKLSRAYLASFGMETPLSKRQRSVLNRRAIAPETLSPQVKGLIGRILVQRLTNEPE